MTFHRLAVAACLIPVAWSGRTATGCPDQLPATEDDRSAEFKRIHKTWPPPLRYPGGMQSTDAAAWMEYLQKKEDEVMANNDNKWRWEYWLEHAQVVLLKSFTKRGWGIGQVSEDLHSRVLQHFQGKHGNGQTLAEGAVPGYITGDRSMVTLTQALRQEVTEEVKHAVAKWAGLSADDLMSTSTYGIRTYYKNATLKTHVDRVDTHILSAIYVVDRPAVAEGEDPWWVVADPDLTGARYSTDIKPGQLFFYESAKVNHGRPSTLHQD
eukprot:TRINITY_DN36603_c0_g1_i2.p1 TRINITY_DN36603_c0_g1~~TRINITY_DN36603_c0_g1_i2.p1  ORF type:complete len:298 (+),score=33.01 TRINITY_DN36603_c0_g1_i2:94-894(+)